MDLTNHVAGKQITTAQNEIEIPRIDFESSKLGLGVIMVLASFVGVWGAACLINGLGGCESLGQLGRGLLTAITGM